MSDIEKELKKGIVKFHYSKKNGTIRNAYGTLNTDMIPKYLDKQVDKIIELGNALIAGEYSGTDPVDNWSKLTDRGINKDPKKGSDDYIKYYDLEKKNFRQFSREAEIVIY